MIKFRRGGGSVARTGFNRADWIFFLLTFFCFIVSFILYLVFYPGTRKIFLFESLDKNGIYTESRFIPSSCGKPSPEYFTDELLLGPVADRYRRLFAAGTKTIAFFKRNGTLYIDLNENALFQTGNVSDTKTACRLLEQNIRKNYNSVDTIVISMMGRSVYEYCD